MARKLGLARFFREFRICLEVHSMIKSNQPGHAFGASTAQPSTSLWCEMLISQGKQLQPGMCSRMETARMTQAAWRLASACAICHRLAVRMLHPTQRRKPASPWARHRSNPNRRRKTLVRPSMLARGVSANLVHGFERFNLQNLISFPGYGANGGRNRDANPHQVSTCRALVSVTQQQKCRARIRSTAELAD